MPSSIPGNFAALPCAARQRRRTAVRVRRRSRQGVGEVTDIWRPCGSGEMSWGRHFFVLTRKRPDRCVRSRRQLCGQRRRSRSLFPGSHVPCVCGAGLCVPAAARKASCPVCFLPSDGRRRRGAGFPCFPRRAGMPGCVFIVLAARRNVCGDPLTRVSFFLCPARQRRGAGKGP